jgi:hypothetical protein
MFYQIGSATYQFDERGNLVKSAFDSSKHPRDHGKFSKKEAEKPLTVETALELPEVQAAIAHYQEQFKTLDSIDEELAGTPDDPAFQFDAEFMDKLYDILKDDSLTDAVYDAATGYDASLNKATRGNPLRASRRDRPVIGQIKTADGKSYQFAPSHRWKRLRELINQVPEEPAFEVYSDRKKQQASSTVKRTAPELRELAHNWMDSQFEQMRENLTDPETYQGLAGLAEFADAFSGAAFSDYLPAKMRAFREEFPEVSNSPAFKAFNGAILDADPAVSDELEDYFSGFFNDLFENNLELYNEVKSETLQPQYAAAQQRIEQHIRPEMERLHEQLKADPFNTQLRDEFDLWAGMGVDIATTLHWLSDGDHATEPDEWEDEKAKLFSDFGDRLEAIEADLDFLALHGTNLDREEFLTDLSSWAEDLWEEVEELTTTPEQRAMQDQRQTEAESKATDLVNQYKDLQDLAQQHWEIYQERQQKADYHLAEANRLNEEGEKNKWWEMKDIRDNLAEHRTYRAIASEQFAKHDSLKGELRRLEPNVRDALAAAGWKWEDKLILNKSAASLYSFGDATYTLWGDRLLVKSNDPVKYLLRWKQLEIGVTHEPGDMRHGRKMTAGYGHIRGTYGDPLEGHSDGMSWDVYFGADLGSDKVFAVKQVVPETGAIDEYKLIIGCWSKEEAKALYLAHMPEKFFGSIRRFPLKKLLAYKRTA